MNWQYILGRTPYYLSLHTYNFASNMTQFRLCLRSDLTASIQHQQQQQLLLLLLPFPRVDNLDQDGVCW